MGDCPALVWLGCRGSSRPAGICPGLGSGKCPELDVAGSDLTFVMGIDVAVYDCSVPGSMVDVDSAFRFSLRFLQQ